MKSKILIATTNPGKIAELKAMLDLDVKWLSLSKFKRIEKVAEDGATFVENACRKAIGYAEATGLWTIADDSGLVIDALDGLPGVHSARFAGGERSVIDEKNVKKVLKLLRGVPDKERTARFICCLCLATPDEILVQTQGTLEGLIAQSPIGRNGFGYDPIFFIPELNKTVAQLTSRQKNAISHRGEAIRKLKPLLFKLLK